MKKGVIALILIFTFSLNLVLAGNGFGNENVDPFYAPGDDGKYNTKTKELIAYYKFENNALDSSGKNNHGIIKGANVNSFGVKNSGAEFNGVNNYIEIPDSNYLDFFTRYTFAGWFYFDEDIGSARLISKEDPTGWSYRLVTIDNGAFGHEDSLLMQMHGYNTQNNNIGVTTSFQGSWGLLKDYKNKWVHIASTYNGTVMKLYVNGEVKTSVNTGLMVMHTTNSSLGIGADPAGNFPFNGNIDELRIYNYELSEEQVRFLASISVPNCGDGIVNNKEICDSSSRSCTINGYPGTQNCNSQCNGFNSCTSSQSCGDGIVNGNEVCDSGLNNGRPNFCNIQCTAMTIGVCGNNILESGEQCDDGNTNNNDACKNSCLNNVCGDGIIRTGAETCDDGNLVNGDGCSGQCLIEIIECVESWACGEWTICINNSQTRECIDSNLCGTTNNLPSLNQTCVSSAICGNGLIESPETCDDGNIISNDGCSSACQTESAQIICGDGVTTLPFEECDDGNIVSNDGCSASCSLEAPPICGDGVLQLSNGEECDDRNTINGDGCSSACKIESISLECNADSDCPSSEHENYCSSDQRACTSSINFICVAGECIQSGSGSGCSLPCENGCSNGACLPGNQTVICENGCEWKHGCVPRGIRVAIENGNSALYCNPEGQLAIQKGNKAACQNNYECLSELCSNGECTIPGNVKSEQANPKKIRKAIGCWVSHPISKAKRDACLLR